MSRIAAPAPHAAPDASRPILDAVQKQLGVVPNLHRTLALSPAALQGYAALNTALGRTLDLRTRERIAIAVAEVNGCDYCLSAHAYIAQHMAKLGADDVARARNGDAADPRAAAATRFAAGVARARGHVTDADLAAIRDAGFSDAEIVEIVAVVAENVLTNFINVVAGTDIDFPVLHTAAAA